MQFFPFSSGVGCFLDGALVRPVDVIGDWRGTNWYNEVGSEEPDPCVDPLFLCVRKDSEGLDKQRGEVCFLNAGRVGADFWWFFSFDMVGICSPNIPVEVFFSTLKGLVPGCVSIRRLEGSRVELVGGKEDVLGVLDFGKVAWGDFSVFPGAEVPVTAENVGRLIGVPCRGLSGGVLVRGVCVGWLDGKCLVGMGSGSVENIYKLDAVVDEPVFWRALDR